MGATIEELQRALGTTLARVDDAIFVIETRGYAGAPLVGEALDEYHRGLDLRERAKKEFEQGKDVEGLKRANLEAAHALLAMREVMRRLDIMEPEERETERATPTCFYCGHDDYPPYRISRVTDNRGNSLQVAVCSSCDAHGEGREGTPEEVAPASSVLQSDPGPGHKRGGRGRYAAVAAGMAGAAIAADWAVNDLTAHDSSGDVMADTGDTLDTSAGSGDQAGAAAWDEVPVQAWTADDLWDEVDPSLAVVDTDDSDVLVDPVTGDATVVDDGDLMADGAVVTDSFDDSDYHDTAM